MRNLWLVVAATQVTCVIRESPPAAPAPATSPGTETPDTTSSADPPPGGGFAEPPPDHGPPVADHDVPAPDPGPPVPDHDVPPPAGGAGLVAETLRGVVHVDVECTKQACRDGDVDCPCRTHVSITPEGGVYRGRTLEIDGHGCHASGMNPRCGFRDGQRAELPGAVVACPRGACSAVIAPPGGAVVTGTIWRTRATHCGGARPRPGEPMSTRGPAASETMPIVRGNRNDTGRAEAYASTDAAGRFAVGLAAGTWCFVEQGKLAAPAPGAAPSPYVDATCIADRRRTCDAVVTVPPTPAPLTIDLVVPCFGPCYHGPLPP